MRIIAGVAKGCRIRVPKVREVRPTQDRVREALFMILGFPLQSSAVLDLYAGSGALGIEALSRGAAFGTFVDRNPLCLQAIGENLRSCRLQERSAVLKGNLPQDYPRIARELGKTYDLVLLDPPYRSGLGSEVLLGLHRFSLLKENATIVLEHSSRDPLLPKHQGFPVQQQRIYGDTSLTFFLYQRREILADETHWVD